MSNSGWITINSLNYIHIVNQIESFITVESFKFVGGGGNFHSCQILFGFSQCHLDLLASMKRGIYTDSIYCMKQRSKLFLGKFVVGWGVFMSHQEYWIRYWWYHSITMIMTWYIKIQQNINTWHNTYWLNHSKLLEFLMHIFLHQFY